ncbi:unnamed protein product [Amaranthus hypochondriacus]
METLPSNGMLSTGLLMDMFQSVFKCKFQMSDDQETYMNTEIWKIKKLIKVLEVAWGNGTSMFSLIMPPKYQVVGITKMLKDEYGTVSNIKSMVNRQSLLAAITSAQ